MTEFCEAILQNRVQKLETLEDSKRDLMDTETDAGVNTQLSVIDRFLLSSELNKQELVHETFTIFTSVSIPILSMHVIKSMRLICTLNIFRKSNAKYYVTYTRTRNDLESET